MMRTADGRWEGIAIEIWENVARRMGVAFEYREYNGMAPLVTALEIKAIDLIPSLPVELRYEAAIDFSQSIVFVASVTANITASLTIGELRGHVRGFGDLQHARVGVLPQSEAMHFLNKHGIATLLFDGTPQGLEAVATRKIDAFVVNEMLLKYQVKNDFQGRVQVLPIVFDDYFVALAIQEKAPLRKPINKALLAFMRTQEWIELQKRYIPGG